MADVHTREALQKSARVASSDCGKGAKLCSRATYTFAKQDLLQHEM